MKYTDSDLFWGFVGNSTIIILSIIFSNIISNEMVSSFIRFLGINSCLCLCLITFIHGDEIIKEIKHLSGIRLSFKPPSKPKRPFLKPITNKQAIKNHIDNLTIPEALDIVDEKVEGRG